MTLLPGQLPKGMVPPVKPAEEKPKHVTMADGNYVAAIYKALEILPVEVRVDRCQVLEEYGRPPRIDLALTVTGEKEVPDAKS